MIALTGATKRYNGTTVLDDVTTSFGEEGITSLIGPNGAGKSTLFGLVGRLIVPQNHPFKKAQHAWQPPVNGDAAKLRAIYAAAGRMPADQ